MCFGIAVDFFFQTGLKRIDNFPRHSHHHIDRI